jgi:drug/metabolite transporter (DMT)-like permease
MLWGGVLLSVAGLLHGDWEQFHVSQVSLRSVLAFLYLLALGSIVAFTAYMWLLRVTTPSRVATYAYVNPVVAVLLGWMFNHEPVSGRMVVAMVVILSGVVMITTLGARARSEKSGR